MNTILKKIQWFLGLLLVFVTGACTKNETENITDFQWQRAEFTIRRGHLHGVNFHGNPESELFPNQKYIFEKTDSGKIIRKDETGKVLSDNESPILMQSHWQYALEIVYFNKEGQRINKVLSNQSSYFQHFFSVENYLNTKTNQTIFDTGNLISYRYRDTDPEHIQKDLPIDPSNARLGRSKLSNADVGLKGYFSPQIAYSKFNLNVNLIKTEGAKSKGTFVFNEVQKAKGTSVFSVAIPVHIFIEPSQGIEGDFERYINELAQFFNKTEQQIRDLLEKGGKEAENSVYWM